MRSDHCHLTAYQIGCEVRQPIVLVLRPAILDRYILALDVPGFANALPECGHKACSVAGDELLRNPITGIGGCCARAASGHAAAPPATPLMKSRRLMQPPGSSRH